MKSFNDLPSYYRHLRQEIFLAVPVDALNILDVGCGAGVLGKALKQQNPKRRVVGIELNEEAFYYAKQNLDTAYHANVDNFNPPLSQGEFDCIIFADVLEHLVDPWHIARQYASFLKKKGTLVASIPNIRHLPILKQLLEDGSWEYQDEGILDRTHLRFFTKKEFVKLLSQADIVCKSVTLLGGSYLHSLHQRNDRRVRSGNLVLENISDEVFKELCAYQLLFTGVYDPEGSEANNLLSLKGTTVVVPWWDHGELINLWENNIKYLQDSEIIFIDNGSGSETKTTLEKFCNRHNVKLIRNEKNRGFAAANNQGLEIANCEYILHLNNDIEILQSPIEYLCQKAAEGLAGPGYVQNDLGEFYVEGWALCIKKSILKSLGGWSEDYGFGYWDDVDLCHRARLAGYTINPVTDINKYIRHITNATGRDGRFDQIALHLKNRKIYLDKYYSSSPKILIDGVFFQLYNTGIARVWRSVLEEWTKSDFAKYIVVLDRGGTAPKIPGIRYRSIPTYSYAATDADKEMLQQVCDEEGADLFISTYYTTPISTPSVFMAYDMIPEVLGADFNEPMWREKHNGIRHASAYISISENTASDLVKCFSGISPEQVTVAHCGVSNTFTPATQADIQQFKMKYGISKPYFILVGAGSNYKNAGLFFQAFAQLYSKQGFEIVCTGGSSLWLSAEYRQFTSGCVVHPLQLSDEELSTAYSGATALVYPSLYEGFGMPVAEAMACGCPVITCKNSSIPEVAGEAAIYVNEKDINAMANALCEVQKPEVRRQLIETGLQQAHKFTWSKMADTVSSALINATLLRLNLREINLIIFPDWTQDEESLGSDLAQVIKSVITHPDSSRMTLLIDNSNISPEEADLALSSIVMNLMMEEELEVPDEPNISLIGQLSEIQWSALIPHLQGRIVLEHENQDAIKQTQAENLPTVELDSL